MTTSVLPSDGDFVELAATNKGKMFRKRILRVGESFVHPSNPDMKVTVDKKFADKLVENFNAGYCDTVQFPMVNDKNQHVENPASNMGQVVNLTHDDEGVYATIDVRKHADEVGTTILGASAFMNLNYKDTVSGEKVGPTLLHVAATNRPYLTKLGPYESVALSASEDSDDNDLVVLSRSDEGGNVIATKSIESDTHMDKQELIDALRDEHNIDVDALIAERTGKGNLVAALSNVLRTADPDLIALSDANAELTVSEIADGVVELSRNYANLSERFKQQEAEAATEQINELIRKGKVLPHQREAMLELRLTNTPVFEALVPDHAIVELSETGVTSHEQPGGAEFEDAAAEVDRYVTKIDKSIK